MMNRLSAILDATGHPFEMPNGKAHANGVQRGGMTKVQMKTFLEQANSFIESLGMIGAPVMNRAQDPVMNNPWIFVSALTVALAAGSAPLRIYRETGKAVDNRKRKAIDAGRMWEGAKSGKRRRAVERHLSGSVLKRFFWKANGIEEDLDHPLFDVLIKHPNDFQNGSQLRQFTFMELATQFECMWVLSDAQGGRLKAATDPVGQIWPYSGKNFVPRLEFVTYGRQIGWWFRPPYWSPYSVGPGTRIPIDMHEVIVFKFPNPADPLRGLARMTGAAQNIELDELSIANSRGLLKRGATPKGIMTYDGSIEEGEIKDKQRQFEEEYGGAENVGSTLFIHGGWKYQQAGFSPQQLENRDTLEWNREAELAAMGTSLSAIGISSSDTYAAELIHDKGLWSKTIIPMFRIIEETLDATLFYLETDDTFAGFDLTNVEALRAGVEHKVNIANTMTGPNLHATPRVAYDTVGLDVEDYEGIDKALVGGIMTPVGQVLNPPPVAEEDTAPPGSTPKEPTKPTDPDQPAPSTPADGNPPDDAADAAKLRAPAGIKGASAEIVTRARRKWADFVKVEAKYEKELRAAFRAWVLNQRKGILRRFDEITGKKANELDLTGALPDPDEAYAALHQLSLPIHYSALEAVWQLTEEEIGIPTFDMGDDRIVRYFDQREKAFVQTTVGTLIKRVRAAIESGVQNDETIQEIRLRISSALDIEAGASRTLLVARTETAGFMNGVRQEMFAGEGFEELDWITAGDKNVRDTHVIFGTSGSKPRGFNYLTLVGEAGSLTFPGDNGAPASEVCNCRCLLVPAESKPGKSRDTLRHAERFTTKLFDERFASYRRRLQLQEIAS